MDVTSGIPVGTGFVVLLDEDSSEVARALNSSDGRFTLRAPAAGMYRLRSERIGYRAGVSPLFELGPDSTLHYTLRVAALPVRLAAVTVAGENQCLLRPDTTAATALAWEEARKALEAAAWTASWGGYWFSTQLYERELDFERRRVVSDESKQHAGYYRAPFASVDAETLAREGYVVRGESAWVVYAPDAKVLLHPSFLDSHCFRLVRGESEGEQRIGIGFEPVPGTELADVAGTLWLSEESSELRRLDLRYSHLPGEIDDDRLGGNVFFMPTPAGAWIIREWQLRMPIFSLRWMRGVNEIRWETFLEGFSDTGGEVLAVRSPGGTIVYDAVLATVTGTVRDTVSGRPLVGARVFLLGIGDSTQTDAEGRFWISVAYEGDYELSYRHPLLDELDYQPAAIPVALGRGRTETVTLVAPSLLSLAVPELPSQPRVNPAADVGSAPLSSRAVLQHVRRDLEELYHDPGLSGLDWIALSQSAADRMDRAPVMSAAFEIVDQLLGRLDDSHTFIIPPTWVRHLEYGFDVNFVGDTAFVTAVSSGSNAEHVGLRVGDQMIALGEDVLDQRSFGRTWYRHTVVNPREHLTVVVGRPSGQVVELPISPNVVERPRTVRRPRGEGDWMLPWFRENDRVWDYAELATGVSVWRFGLFDPEDRDDVAEVFERATNRRALILDLRENHGGVLTQLQYFLGFLFPGEMEVGRLVDRDGERTLLTEPQRRHVFSGELVVLVSSATGSTAEMLASVVQRRGRGRVVGDRTAGAGMVSKVRWHRMADGEGRWEFGVSVSVAEYRTSDGGRLEGAGIVPDEYLLITRSELELGEDPVLARALRALGLDVDAATAANVFNASGSRER